MTKNKRGFAAMSTERQRQIAAQGGIAQGKENNLGNFANRREAAREAGRKGGLARRRLNGEKGREGTA